MPHIHFWQFQRNLNPDIFVTNIIYALEVSFALFSSCSNMAEKLTSKMKTRIIIVIIVGHLSLCESKLLFSWLKQKRVGFLFGRKAGDTSKPVESNVCCCLHGFV